MTFKCPSNSIPLSKFSDAVSDSVRVAIHFFVNFDIFKWLYLACYIGSIYTKLGDFVKLGLHFITMWINSC